VDAFQATLQEAIDADLLLHVVDASNPGFPEQMAQVQKVLQEIGAAEIPQILIFNKLDSLQPDQRPQLLQDQYEVDGQLVPRLFVSARSGEGLDALRHELAAKVVMAEPGIMTPDGAAELPGDAP
jgi:GTP-binding protein HflX